MVRGKNVQFIPQECVRAGSKMIEPPPQLEHCCEFRNPYEVGSFLFERIEPDRINRIGGIDDNQLVAQVTAQSSFAGVDHLQKKRRGITVKIEVEKSAIRLNVLLTQVAQERTLARPGLAEYGDMHRTAGATQSHMPPRHLTIHDAGTKIKASRFVPCSAIPPSKPVPDRRNKLFNEAFHLVLYPPLDQCSKFVMSTSPYLRPACFCAEYESSTSRMT